MSYLFKLVHICNAEHQLGSLLDLDTDLHTQYCLDHTTIQSYVLILDSCPNLGSCAFVDAVIYLKILSSTVRTLMVNLTLGDSICASFIGLYEFFAALLALLLELGLLVNRRMGHFS